MIKRLFFVLLQFLLCLSVSAVSLTDKEIRRQIRSIRENLKEQKGAEALRTVESLRKDSAHTLIPQILQYGAEACRIMNNKENEKIYLKSKPDTAAFFNTLYSTCDYILLTDSAERQSNHLSEIFATNEKNETSVSTVKYRFRKQNQDFLVRNYRNLAAANRFFSAKARWHDVQRFTAMAIKVATSPMACTLRQPLATDEEISRLAVAYVNSCFVERQYNDIECFADYALRDSSSRETILEKLVIAEENKKNINSYRRYLKDGHSRYPTNMFFFSRLVDSFLLDGDSEAVLLTANQTLEAVLAKAQDEALLCIIDSEDNYQQPSVANALYGVRSSVMLPDSDIAKIFEARAIAYHNTQHPEQCIEEAKNILNWNPSHVRAPYYIGASYYRLAERIRIPVYVTDPDYQKATAERNQYLQLARPYLERYRQLVPSDNAVWAPLLYEIYLYLNLGTEFEEVGRYIP